MTVPTADVERQEAWPALPWRDWEPTMSTLHRWVQIVGKLRMALAPPLNHWWHITLYVSARGLTTSAIPYKRRSFQVDFDFIEHRLRATDSDGGGSLSRSSRSQSPASTASSCPGCVAWASTFGSRRRPTRSSMPRPSKLMSDTPPTTRGTHTCSGAACARPIGS